MTEQRFGRYRLLSLLGRGGMGEVWRALDTEKDREVALKILRPGLDAEPDFVTRFRREAARAARLRSPHIVSIHDYGEIDGRLFIDMELIDGQDLGALLADGPLAPERAVAIVAQVARALGVAHAAQLVHRDVKPSNVLVSTADDDHTHLIDFGIVRALDGTRLTTVGVIGTPAYMAPECFGGDGDVRSDVYSLGCVLFEALTGRQPFTAPHAFAYGHLHQHEPAPLPSSIHDGVPPALDAVVGRALAKDPAERYPTTSELASAARRALGADSGQRARPEEPPSAVAPTTIGNTAPPTTGGPGAPPTLDAGPPTSGGGTPAPPPRPPVAEGEEAKPVVRRRRRWVVVALSAALVLVAVGVAALRTSGSTAATPPPAAAPNAFLTSGTSPIGATTLDGRPVVVSAADDALRVWDLVTGQQIGEPFGSSDGATTIGWLDGRQVVAVVGADGTARIWDLVTRRQVGQFATGHIQGVQALTLTRLGVEQRPLAVTGSQDGTARVTDLTTGRQIGEPLVGHTSYVNAVATTDVAGRTVVVTGSGDGSVRRWDLATHQQIGQPLVGHTSYVAALAVAQVDGRPVAVTASGDATVRVWDLTTGAQVGQPLVGHTKAIHSVSVTQLGGRPVAVTGSYDSTARIWDLTTGRQLGQPLTGHPGGSVSVVTTEIDGRPFAITDSGADDTIVMWDLLAAAGP